VTFDTGGLDIKPSSNMRLMKKDMGGSAALAGLAHWLGEAQISLPVDIYLGLAENSVDGKSMRPSDVLIARSGMSVEIHNTDAEGRLVLADVLDVAVTQKNADEPSQVIDVATLTGAIKAGLGAEISGLFCNDDSLAKELESAGQLAGEPNWRMPLYSRYGRNMDSSFADIVNCVDGFGGAITAALFLEKFIRGKSWAHMDIYGWNDRAQGALTFAGGSGQAVQTLIEFLQKKALKR
jgi:leucyl aminopeptidase